MLVAALVFIAITALGFVFPWVKSREQPPHLLLWIVLLSLILIGLLLGLPIEEIIKKISD